MRRLLIALFALGVALPAWGRDIIGCHDAVLSGDTGVLQNDLDCGGADFGRWGVTLAPGASLDLNGHAIRNEFGGVWCQGKCRIKGPGEISDMSALAILTNGKTKIADVLVRDSGGGIFPADAAGDLQRLRSVQLTLRNVTLARTASGIYGWRITAKNVNVVDSGYGLYGDRVTGTSIAVTGNAASGVRATKTKLIGLTATGNGGAGVDALYMRLKGATVTGNDGLGLGRDIVCRASEPLLIDTTCGRSSPGDASDYDVCAND